MARKFSYKRLYKLLRGIVIFWAIVFILLTFTSLIYYYTLLGCEEKVKIYREEEKEFAKVEKFCHDYDFIGKWGQNATDWEKKYHLKGDYKIEDCVAAYEKQETLEAVSDKEETPKGIKEKFWDPPNYLGNMGRMMGVRIIGEPRQAPPIPNYPTECFSFKLDYICFYLLSVGLSPLFIFFLITEIVTYIFPKTKR